jgi:SAM-dependent methyltransferase
MRYTDYDPMAWLYATHWGGEYHEQGYSILERVLLQHLHRGSSILDLCCGDGRIAQALSLHGFSVTGLDGSERMLDYARERAPGVPFIVGDARAFEFERKFDAAIATFDALNHVMSVDELLSVFRCVEQSLRPAGTFVFDMNREEAYTSLWTTTYAMVEPEMVCVCTGGYDTHLRTAHANFTLFRDLDGVWDRSDFRMLQRCHDPKDVEASLYAAGFADVSTFDAASDLGMFGNIGKGRNYYVARKAV